MAATLYLISGMVGAGKTTLAKQLEAKTGAIRLSPDDGIKALAKDPASRAEADALRDSVEAMQWRTASRLLQDGHSVIQENGFWRRTERLERLAAAQLLRARVELHFLDVPLEVLLARIEARNHSPGNTSFEVKAEEVKRWLERLEVPRPEEEQAYDRFVRYGPTGDPM